MSPGRPPSSRTLRRGLVESLEASGALTDPAVRDAFLAVPRERFLADAARSQGLTAIYANKAIVTRTDERGRPTSSSSQPSIMALMLERLELRPGHRVLEIGAGSGYNAALLSTLVGNQGRVTSVELEPDLAAGAAAALAGGGHSVDVVVGDGHQGWPGGAPYDRIVVTASTATVPRSWFDQLAPEGLLELPLHLDTRDLQAVVTFRRHGPGLRSTAVVDGAFMVLRPPEPDSGPVHAATLSVSELVDGDHRSLGLLSGDGLRALRPIARRRLAALMLCQPLRHRLGPAPAGRSPGLFLRLATPRGAVMLSYSRSGLNRTMHWPVAAATPDGRGLAVLYLTGTGMRLESYGDPRAGNTLTTLLDDWRVCGRPSPGDIVVEVTYDDARRSVVTTTWDQSSTVSSRR